MWPRASHREFSRSWAACDHLLLLPRQVTDSISSPTQNLVVAETDVFRPVISGLLGAAAATMTLTVGQAFAEVRLPPIDTGEY